MSIEDLATAQYDLMRRCLDWDDGRYFGRSLGTYLTCLEFSGTAHTNVCVTDRVVSPKLARQLCVLLGQGLTEMQ